MTYEEALTTIPLGRYRHFKGNEYEVIKMANDNTKDFNAMLHDSKDMPKIQTITDEGSIKRYGGDRMYFAPPIDYDTVMKRIPEGKLTKEALFELEVL